MGTWGTDLYSDDIACEVRDEYLDALKVGLAGPEAAKQVLLRRGSALENRQMACGVYFALAETAWKCGRLTEEVRSAALALLESGGDLPIWAQDAPAELHARRAVLERLETRLRSPQPQVRPVKLKPKAEKVVRTDLPAGTAWLLDLPSGHRAALVIVGFKDLGSSLEPLFSVSRWRGTRGDIPPLPLIASMGTVNMPSFRKEHAHVGILPPDGKKSLMSGLQPFGIVEPALPFSPSDAVWLSIGRIASELDRRLGGEYGRSASTVMK